MAEAQRAYEDKIVSDPEVLHGKTRLRETGLLVEHVIGHFQVNLDGSVAAEWAVHSPTDDAGKGADDAVHPVRWREDAA